MKSSRFNAALVLSAGMLLPISVVVPECAAAAVDFVANNGDFNLGSSWSDGNVPMADFDRHYVQDNLTALFTGNSTQVHWLTVGDTSYGRLRMTGGSLDVLITDQFEVGESIGGEGEFLMTGSSVLTAAGAVIGTRSKGLLSVGSTAVVDLFEDAVGFRRDLRVGSYGPAFVPGGPPEPGLDGNGLVDVQGTLNAATLIISQSGGRGEFRLSGGAVDLAGGVRMDLCEGCGTDPTLLALRAAKLSIVGSSGSFSVGIGDIRASSPTATFSFTADAGGVTTIVAANSAAEIDTARLELSLDAFPFTPTSRLTLIDALDAPGLVIGEFGSVTFLGTTLADVHYDLLNSDVYLDNFRRTTDGDFDDDGDYDCADVNSLVGEIAAHGNTVAFDLTGDKLVNESDLDAWLVQGGANNPTQTNGNPFLKGDANLNGAVDGSDFGIWNSNKFTTTAAWCSGDFSADGAVDGSDFGIWNAHKFTASDSLMVPEPIPSIWSWSWIVLLTCACPHVRVREASPLRGAMT